MIVCPLVFLAGFVDAAAGGGGLISLPAYMIVGLNPIDAIGTNKFSASCGTLVATMRYSRCGFIHWREMVLAIIAALTGSWFGARLALMVENEIFKIIMLVILPITAIFVLNKRALSKYRCPYTTRQTKTIVTILALVMGLYDGFYGPGTGTFLMLMLVGIAHISLEQAVGTTKVINLSTNLASLSVYLVHGKVLFPLALVAAVFGIAGNYIGARHFTRKGAKFVKPIIVAVLVIFFIKLCWELFIAR
ncbi:MAG: TSUP family transporter [Alistipes sp.]|nr:TSUP family transporter [Alistipes sp.]